MKKLFIVLAIGAFAACNGGATEAPAVDSTAVTVDSTVAPAVDSTVAVDSAAAPVDSAAAAK